MKAPLLASFIFCAASQVFAQTTAGDITTLGKCSPVLIQPKGKVEISCDGAGLSPAQVQRQAKEYAEILSTIRKNSLSFDIVIAKLNELLKRTNPNGTVITYDCGGIKRTVTMATGETLTEGDLPATNVKSMVDAVKASRPDLELNACLAQIEAKPEWLTPRLFCAGAYVDLREMAKAKQMLDYYDANVGEAYDRDPFCTNISAKLHTVIK